MDKSDFVWFGTWDGLNKYDGTHIQVYKPDLPSGTSLSNNIIRQLIEDKEGNLWIATHHGINRYRTKADNFESYFIGLDNLPILEYNSRISLGPDSTLWANIIGHGVSRYNSLVDKFEPVAIQGVSADWLKQAEGIASFSEIIYFLGSDGQLLSTSNRQAVYKHKVCNPQEIKHFSFFKTQSHFYLAIVTKQHVLKLFNLTRPESQPWLFSCKDNPITCLSNGTQEYIWLGTEKGNILKLKFAGEKTELVDMSAYMPLFAKEKRKILSIAETTQGLLWIGADGDGIYKFSTKENPFFSITNNRVSPGISNSIVRSIWENADGSLMVGTRGGGLNIISNDYKTARVITASHGLSNNTIFALYKDEDGNLWIGLDGEGIDRIDRVGRICHFPRDFKNRPSIHFGNVYSIHKDKSGNLWLGTSGHGVVQLKISKDNTLDFFRQITLSAKDSNAPRINSNVVYSIAEESPSALWFGTRGAGIYRYNPLQNKIEQRFSASSPKGQNLSNNDVLSLLIDSENQLWIGTSGGLNKLPLGKSRQTINYFTQKEGLPNNTIHGIAESRQKILFLSTNNGLVAFNPSKLTFNTYSADDGLANSEYTDGASFCSKISSRLFFGGIRGLDIVYPEKIKSDVFFPRLAITEFKIHNTVVSPIAGNGLLENHIDAMNSIDLKHDQNFISFHFTTLDYGNNQHTQYAYFLENFDQSWNEIGTHNTVNLTNIPPGRYKLHIRYSKFGIPAPHPKIISITIAYPFWKTRGAYLLYALFLILLQTGIIIYIRQRAKNKRAAAIDKFKIQQLKEMNDYKLKFFTNIAHEFRTPLTLIFGPVTLLMKMAKTHWEKTQLKSIYNNSLRLQKLIEELIQFRKIESGKDQLSISETELVSFTQHIADTFSLHASDHQVHLEFIPQIETAIGWIDKEKAEKILINLISNAIKYNHIGGSVEIELLASEETATFVIRDTGIGIHETMHEKVFELFCQNPHQPKAERLVKSSGIGLSLTKSLITLHHGAIRLESKPGQGTVFTVQLPINKSRFNENDFSATNHAPHNTAEKVSLEFNLSENQSPALSAEEEKSDGNAGCILAVDDNEKIIELLRSILPDKYSVLSAQNGAEALKIIEAKKIDIVISDIMMPVMDGYALCKHIKDNIHCSHIPVILLTAKTEIEDRIHGLEMGADSYIPKPFHPDHLFVRIEKLLKSREQAKINMADLENSDGVIQTGISEKEDAFFLKITNCIRAHLSELEFSADDIAKEVGFSKGALYKKIKAVTNQTPHGLIKKYRLQKAASLLQHSNLTVSEVIYETGFNSRSYFYKSFNEMYHCHPKDYPKKEAKASKSIS